MRTRTTAAPRAEPAESIDPWQCLTENLTQYLDVPKPTGSLFKELQSHGSKLYEPYLAAPTLTAFCPFPAQSSWCAFTTSAPLDVLPAYSSYASQAYSWWSAHSSSVVSLAQQCPIGWENAILMHPGGDMWLNDTIAFAGCHAEAHTTVGSSPTEPTAATTRSGVDVGGGSPTPTTDASSSVLSRAGPKM
ncbi:hypothetical protein VE01_01290 [Pseudogymnoascus verrucosus]|uniref:DUF7735 domain-containing protein n=1 Tax=Pseudogymnoascus verrucosus TaxID=342668 RepID=A0A1B8GYD7_9PEZI|nr:uncharacterized protein VE01_01290 [Pseudogymnoascus verrucosus]OBU00844.1 hypothetical protein VE01_01290 [Pseudogymnoascus verrucosus]